MGPKLKLGIWTMLNFSGSKLELSFLTREFSVGSLTDLQLFLRAVDNVLLVLLFLLVLGFLKDNWALIFFPCQCLCELLLLHLRLLLLSIQVASCEQHLEHRVKTSNDLTAVAPYQIEILGHKRRALYLAYSVLNFSELVRCRRARRESYFISN